MLYCTWSYAKRAQLIRAGTSEEIVTAVDRRIVTAQSLYALGAALRFFSTYWSIAFIFIVQLYYVVAPRFQRAARA
jgi:type IV secretory pathway TrbD component